jgi:hypothetical protein
LIVGTRVNTMLTNKEPAVGIVQPKNGVRLKTRFESRHWPASAGRRDSNLSLIGRSERIFAWLYCCKSKMPRKASESKCCSTTPK